MSALPLKADIGLACVEMSALCHKQGDSNRVLSSDRDPPRGRACLASGQQGPRKTEWQYELATFRVELYCNGELSQRGSGALVLGSPLLALRHLIELLANDPHNPPLHAGEIISTGTLTLAMPVSAGETWSAKVTDIPLEEI